MDKKKHKAKWCCKSGVRLTNQTQVSLQVCVFSLWWILMLTVTSAYLTSDKQFKFGGKKKSTSNFGINFLGEVFNRYIYFLRNRKILSFFFFFLIKSCNQSHGITMKGQRFHQQAAGLFCPSSIPDSLYVFAWEALVFAAVTWKISLTHQFSKL